jgi:uncharacterized protein YndB with AHSA1/START domain
MIKMAAEVTIHRTAEQVFEYLAALANLTKWQGNVVRATVTTPGPVRVGTEYTQTMRMGPATVEGKCRITGFEPGRALGFTLESRMLNCAGELRLDPVPDGTRLTSTGTGHLRGPWRVLTSMVQAQVKRESVQEVARIKADVEATGNGAKGRGVGRAQL